VLVYSITLKESIEAAEQLFNHIMRIKEDYLDIPVVIVGNKQDLEEERMVSVEEGQGLANKCNRPVFEASAKTGYNVNEIFYSLVRDIRTWRTNNLQQPTPLLRKSTPKKKKGCLLF